MTNKAYIGIGSNLGNASAYCYTALNKLRALPEIRVAQCSSLYETEPIGIKNQNWFINAVLLLETSLTPTCLLNAMMEVEQALGRVRKLRWGPRLIDLDLLSYDDKIIEEENLKVPHPEMIHRTFVMAPLCEIDPNWTHPVLNQTANEILHAIPNKTIIRKIVSLA